MKHHFLFFTETLRNRNAAINQHYLVKVRLCICGERGAPDEESSVYGRQTLALEKNSSERQCDGRPSQCDETTTKCRAADGEFSSNRNRGARSFIHFNRHHLKEAAQTLVIPYLQVCLRPKGRTDICI